MKTTVNDILRRVGAGDPHDEDVYVLGRLLAECLEQFAPTSYDEERFLLQDTDGLTNSLVAEVRRPEGVSYIGGERVEFWQKDVNCQWNEAITESGRVMRRTSNGGWWAL